MKAKYVSVKVKLPEFTVCSEALHHLPAGPADPSRSLRTLCCCLQGSLHPSGPGSNAPPQPSAIARIKAPSSRLPHSVPAWNRVLVMGRGQGLSHRFSLPLHWELLKGQGPFTSFISLSSSQPGRSSRFTGWNWGSLAIRAWGAKAVGQAKWCFLNIQKSIHHVSTTVATPPWPNQSQSQDPCASVKGSLRMGVLFTGTFFPESWVLVRNEWALFLPSASTEDTASLCPG